MPDCAVTVLGVTGRDPDPTELHRRFEEIIAGMDLEDLKTWLASSSRSPAAFLQRLNRVHRCGSRAGASLRFSAYVSI